MAAAWENVVAMFEDMYPPPRRPQIVAYLQALRRAAPNAMSFSVPGNGACMISSLNATLASGIIDPNLGGYYVNTWVHAIGMPLEVVDGGMRRDDLSNTKLNNLSINWLNVIAHAVGISVVVLVERRGNLSVYKATPLEGQTSSSTHYLLLHNGHFWPLSNAVDSSLWVGGTRSASVGYTRQPEHQVKCSGGKPKPRALGRVRDTN